MENRYYVYGHIRNDNNTFFYIGKGTDNRASVFTRNKKHDEIANKYGWHYSIIKDNLSEKDAYQEEYNTIIDLITNKGYGIDIDGFRGNDRNKFLTNQTFGSQGSIGISNPMYGISPRERMSDEIYTQWFKKNSERCKLQVGEKNPNFGNKALHNKLELNPELRMQYYSRPGAQNGRAVKVELYDLNWNYIKTFNYIGECAQYIKNVTGAFGSVNSIRSCIRSFCNKGKPFHGFRYKLISSQAT